MKKGMPWASPSLDAWVFLKFAGVNHGGIPKLRLFTLLDHIISSSSLDPWKLPSHQTPSNLIRGLVHNQNNKSTWFSFNTSLTPINTLAIVTTSFKNSFSQKNTKRKSLRGKCKHWQKSVKTEQHVKMNFLENLTLLRSENPELEKVAYIAQEYAQNIWGRFDISGIYGKLNGEQQNLFPAQKSESIASTFH